ncbi:MAG: efflux RND transporter permease subunit [Alphaproteobacteria bacterium]|jgi:multidrug efflux pump|nr:efflux RND transporter permease subunit [Alphaproteobacteria bacterium]MBP9776402.1 efflux RND transporter permease subunit [Alphaproteobacteria bacterium]
MLISDTAIKRPVFAVALSLMIIIVGLLSYMNLSLQQYPDVEEQVLNVDTIYSGAASGIIESKVTTVLEDGLSGIPGLDYMESSSKTGHSQIFLFFRPGTSLSDAGSDVRERIAQVRDSLPEECKDPKVIKSSAGKDPFMFVTLTSDTHNELELDDYAERNLKGPFEALPGVGGADIYGNAITMQIRLDREKLKAYNVAVTDVLDTLEESSQELPAGSIIKGKRHVNIVAEAGLNTPKEMGELVVSSAQGHVIHLKDIAAISLDQDTGESQWIPRFNKKPVVFIGIKRKAGGNVLSISAAVCNYIEKAKESLPPGMHLSVGYNFSMFIEASIKAVQITIFEAIILVLLIILFFLHSPRAAIIPLLTIPVSLIGSFAFLYAFHCSINTITLLAMVLAIGLVVDDAIVVLENIHRHIEKGLQPLEAAIKGSREVGFAVIAMTLTLASVYAPIAFVQGLTGKLFAEFAVSLAGAVLISGLVALTLSPMMCSKLLQPKKLEKQGRISLLIERFLSSLDRSYQDALEKVLTFPKLLCGVLIMVFVGGIFLFYKLPSELAPQEDQSIIMAWVQGPEGATLESMLPYTNKLEDLFTSVPEYVGVWIATQRSGIYGGITLKPWHERNRSQSEIIDELRKKAKDIPGVQVSVFAMKNLLTGGQSGLQMGIKTTGSYANLEKEMDKLVKSLKSSPCFESVSHDLHLGTPQLNVQIDRNKASLLGVKVKDIGRTLEVMLSGSRATTFEQDSRHYDVVVQSQEGHKHDFNDIGNFYVKAEQNEDGNDPNKARDAETGPEQDIVPLNHLIKVTEVAVPAELKHLNKMRSVTLNADLQPSCRTDEALSIVNAAIKQELPSSFQSEPIGNLRKFMESQGEMYLMFAAALLFIYLVLAIQFESLVDPLLIMITVPLSLSGALLALYLTGGTLNIFSQVGLITLVGLITKHGILIVEFANKQRVQGLSVVDAARKAASLRLRPILMTTGAMVLGAIPLALATGAGAESRQQIGWVLVGGLLGGTFFTLFAVPFVYTIVKGWKKTKI